MIETVMYGGPQLSRQKKKTHGKRKRLTAKEKTSRQKEKAHDKKKNLAAKIITPSSLFGRELFLFAASFFFWPRAFSFCREVFLFAVSLFFFAARFSFLP